MPPTKPTHRLTAMTTQEVSIVDLPANLRRFLIAKAEPDGSIAGGGSPTALVDEVLRSIAENEFPGAEDLAIFPFLRAWYAGWDSRSETLDLGLAKRGVPIIALPAAARSTLIELAMDTLERFVLAVAMLQSSDVDDEAEIPPELLKLMHGVGSDLARGVERVEAEHSEQRSAESAETQKARRRPSRGDWSADELMDLSAATMTKARASKPSDGIDAETAMRLDAMVIDGNEQDKRAARERAETARLSKAGEPAWPMDLSAAVAAKKEGQR